MKDNIIEDSDRELLGKIKVKPGNENGPSRLVYVHGISTNLSDDDRAMYNCHVINTSEIVFAYAEDFQEFTSWEELEISRLEYEKLKAQRNAKYYKEEELELRNKMSRRQRENL